VGKTTTARIFAKTINCKNFPSAEPCDECASCREINSGSSLDVIELDAASNRGIDAIRELRENTIFAPASSRYKVYIIDEAHQITVEAFNALLKTLEEPPPYIVFILATTEPQKLPLTILSRCQHFRFRLVSDEEIKNTLKAICEKEKVFISEEALDLICLQAGGSIRDAESILEQAISSSEDGKIEREGFSLEQFTRQLLEQIRRILVHKISGKEEFFKHKSKDEVFWMAEVLSKTLQSMKWIEYPKILLELAIYKISSDFVSVASILSQDSENEKQEESTSVPDEKIKSEPEKPFSETTRPSALKSKEGHLDEIFSIIRKKMPFLLPLLELAQKTEIKGDRILLEFPQKYTQQAMRVIANSDDIEKILKEEGRNFFMDIVIIGNKNASKKEKVKNNRRLAQKLEEEEPIIRKLGEIVGGGLEGQIKDEKN